MVLAPRSFAQGVGSGLRIIDTHHHISTGVAAAVQDLSGGPTEAE